ncbi:MAG: hypothetical protein QM504_11035 [Pseudomonadota bacterium]
MLYTDLEIIPGQDNMAGTPIVAWAIPFSDIYQMPEYKPNPLLFDDYAIIYDDIIPRAYKTFYKIYATSDTGKIDDNKITSKESGSYESIYEFYFPKNDKNALGFMRLSASKWIFIVQESDGNQRIMGIQQGLPATITNITATSGTLKSGDKGATFKVRSLQNGPAPIYKGKFNLDRDSNDLSLYPMLYTQMVVSVYNEIGFPLVTDYYLLNKKLFTWHHEWNSQNQLSNRNIVIHVS